MNTAAVSEDRGFRVFLSPLHATRYRYQQGCRCRPCVKANYAYKKAWDAQRRLVEAASTRPPGGQT